MKQVLARFRTSNHKLPIETGGWNDIEKSNRLCNLCYRDIGDEFSLYFVLHCVEKRKRKVYTKILSF